MPRKMLLASMWCGCGPDVGPIPINSTSLEWLFTNASVLLWADKLLITERDYEHLHRQQYFDDDIDRECARMFFDRLRAEGIIEVFNHNRFLNELVLESISCQVDRDENRWGVEPGPPDERGRVAHDTILIGEHRYCQPVVKGIYGSLTVARFLNCSCVFDSRERAFIEARFSTLGIAPEAVSAGQAVFRNLYQVMLPSIHIEREYQLFCDPRRGATCQKLPHCQSMAKANMQRLLEYILIAREKPELKRLAQRLSQIEQEVGPDETRIRQALVREVRREQRNLRAVYPAVHNWSRLTQKVSVPAVLYGTQLQQPLIWMTAAGLSALAEATHHTVDTIEEQHRWLTLLAEEAGNIPA